MVGGEVGVFAHQVRSGNSMLWIRPGTGGLERSQFLYDLVRRLGAGLINGLAEAGYADCEQTRRQCDQRGHLGPQDTDPDAVEECAAQDHRKQGSGST